MCLEINTKLREKRTLVSKREKGGKQLYFLLFFGLEIASERFYVLAISSMEHIITVVIVAET